MEKEKVYITLSVDKLYLLVKEMIKLKRQTPNNETHYLFKKHKLHIEIALLNSLISHKGNWPDHKLEQILEVQRKLLLYDAVKKDLEGEYYGSSVQEKEDDIQEI